MANLRKIRSHIKSVQNTQQITKSMKMVAATKLRRTQTAFGPLRSFAEKSGAILAHVCGGETDNVYLTPHPESKTVCYVLIVGNRGLCGTYNTALLRYLEELRAREARDCILVTAGRWGRDLIGSAGIPLRRNFETRSCWCISISAPCSRSSPVIRPCCRWRDRRARRPPRA